MVRKETCPVCRGNKVVPVERPAGAQEWRSCPGCNGTGFQVRVMAGAMPAYHGPRPF